MDCKTKMTNRGGINLPSVIPNFIQRAPPASITTRRKERVSESDVMWVTRPDGPNDGSRINQGIRYFAAGVNPSVSVDYSGFGSGNKTNSLNNVMPGSIYKLDVIRPPLMPIETQNSLSNPRTHQTVSVQTNMGNNMYALNTLANDVDMIDVTNAIRLEPSGRAIPIEANAYYKLEQPQIMSARFAINENKPSSYEILSNCSRNIDTNQFVCREKVPYGTIVRPLYSNVTTNPTLQKLEDRNDNASAYVKKEILLQNVRPNYQLVIYDPNNHISTQVSASINQKKAIAVQAALGMPITLNAQNGQKIKLKSYNWSVVQTNVGLDQVILSIENPDIQLERNVPLYATDTLPTMPTNINSTVNDIYNLDRNVPIYETNTGLGMPTDVNTIINDIHYLEGRVQTSADTNMNLSNIYNQDYNENRVPTLNKHVFTSSFDNQGSFIPKYNSRTTPQIRGVRDLSRVQNANHQSYDRNFS
jgi:hypothetical protein